MRDSLDQHRIIAFRRFIRFLSASDAAYDRNVTEPRLWTTSSGPLVVFDGDCAFCTSSVAALERLLPRFPAASPWQWLDLDELGLTIDDVTRYAWVVTPTHQYAGHLAASALLRMQRGVGWRFLGHLIATPPFSWIAGLGYRVIAAHRHRLPGGPPACALPPAAR